MPLQSDTEEDRSMQKDNTKELITLLLTPLMTLTGSAVGFYFGHQNSRDGSNSD